MHQVTLSHCPICKSSDISQTHTIKDNSISQEVFHLSKCNQCGFLFTNPQPTPDSLWKYYESEDYVSHSKTTKGFINFWYRQVQQLNLSLKFNAIKSHAPRGTWLDYGAGAGDYVKYIRSRDIAIEGFEPSEAARKTAQDNGVILKETSHLSETPDNSVACISLWHVLEHIPNFTEVIQDLGKLVKQDGILVIAVPNYLSLDGQKYAENWAAYDVPRHLWHFTEKNIKSLANQINFSHVDTSGMIFDSYYVSLLSEKYQNGSKLSGILNGFKSNLSARKKSTPFSSQIYILKKKAI